MAASRAITIGSNDSLASPKNGISSISKACHCFFENCVKHGEHEVRKSAAISMIARVSKTQ